MDVETFIQRWTAREGGAERANYQMFLSELCDLIGAPRPDPAGAERAYNDYVFERAVDSNMIETGSVKRIDLYRRGAFILEAKQSRLPGHRNAVPGQLSLLGEEPEQLGRRSVAKGWDVLMKNAFNQAREYAHLLPTDHPAPPFLIVADVGHCFEIYSDFSGTGRGYSQFPDRKSFRVYMEDLRKPEIRARLARLAAQARDRPWSSARAHLGSRDDKLVTARPMPDRTGPWPEGRPGGRRRRGNRYRVPR